MTDADIKAAIKAIEIHHEHDWWVADMPDIGVATQAKTLPELGVEIERIIIGHFATTAEYGIDPFLARVPSSRDDVERLTTKRDSDHADLARLLNIAKDERDAAEERLAAIDPTYQRDHTRQGQHSIAELTAERDAYRAMICDLLASAVPHPVEHPTMTKQWARAKKLLKEGP